MIEAIGALVFLSTLVVVPLAWRERRDRRAARGLVVRADVQAAMNRRLGGESFVSVQVAPATRWRAGRVELSAPAGWEWLVDEVWRPVLERLPENYELVVTPGRRPVSAGAAAASALKPAA